MLPDISNYMAKIQWNTHRAAERQVNAIIKIVKDHNLQNVALETSLYDTIERTLTKLPHMQGYPLWTPEQGFKIAGAVATRYYKEE